MDRCGVDTPGLVAQAQERAAGRQAVLRCAWPDPRAPCTSAGIRAQLRHAAEIAGVRRWFAPQQLRHGPRTRRVAEAIVDDRQGANTIREASWQSWCPRAFRGMQQMSDQLRPLLEPRGITPGLRVNTNGAVPGGWQVTQERDFEDEFQAWFEGNVKPNFPPDGPAPEISSPSSARSSPLYRRAASASSLDKGGQG